jgi:hypothetical protein
MAFCHVSDLHGPVVEIAIADSSRRSLTGHEQSIVARSQSA